MVAAKLSSDTAAGIAAAYITAFKAVVESRQPTPKPPTHFNAFMQGKIIGPGSLAGMYIHADGSVRHSPEFTSGGIQS